MPQTEQKESIRNLVNSVLHLEKKDYSRGAKHGPTQELYDHFKANESTRTRKRNNILLLRTDGAETNYIKFSNRHRMDQRILSICEFAHVN